MVDVCWTAINLSAGTGGVIALAFVLSGIDRIDAAARGAYLVRLLLLPGLTLLWPVVLIRWIGLERRQRQAQ